MNVGECIKLREGDLEKKHVSFEVLRVNYKIASGRFLGKIIQAVETTSGCRKMMHPTFGRSQSAGGIIFRQAEELSFGKRKNCLPTAGGIIFR